MFCSLSAFFTLVCCLAKALNSATTDGGVPLTEGGGHIGPFTGVHRVGILSHISAAGGSPCH